MKSQKSIFLVTLTLFAIIFSQFTTPQSALAACAGVVYVAPTGSGTNGCSWGTAYTTLQGALADPTLVSGDQIWVAAGTYYPDLGGGQVNDDRNSTFTLENGVSIYGGFVGTETLLTQRNPAVNVTILSGDIGTIGVNTDNAFNVVTALNINTATILDGFTVRDGYADAGSDFGGGMYASSNTSALQITGVTFTNNFAGNGGGLAAFESNLTLTRVIFSTNTARQYGGGIYNQDGSPILVDVIFDSNQTQQPASPGGGMHSTNSNSALYTVAPSLTNVTFRNNRALQGGGGGMFNFESHAILTNVTFNGNTAFVRGGAMLNEGSNPILNNVTISGNTAPAGSGGAIRNIFALGVTPSNPIIRNTILWGDGSEEIVNDAGNGVTITNSVIQGGCPALGTCAGLVTTTPSLSGLAPNGGFTPTMAIGIGSSALNVGNNATCAATDQRGFTRPLTGIDPCDAGAFEFGGTGTTTTAGNATTTYGNISVNLTATVAPNPGGGTVQFYIDGTLVGSAAVNAGTGIATLNYDPSALNAGTYTIRADFSGVGVFLPSTSNPANNGILTVNQRTLNVTASGINKVYDGTVTATVTLNDDRVLGDNLTLTYTATFADKNVGTGKTVSVTGITISGGTDAGNYVLGNTLATTTANITARPITVTAVTDTKVYDGTTTSAGVPTITTGSLGTGDTVTWTQTFDTKNVGTNKTLTPAGTVNDGNGGNNYSVTFVTNTTGVITARAITVTAVTDTKVYDGGTTSAGVPTITTGSLGAGDTVTWTQTFDTKNVGTNKTLTPAGTVNDGNGGNNYTVTFVTNTTGVITTRAITVTAVTDTKVYDGNNTSAGVPTITTGTLAVGDTVTWTQTFDTKNVGTNKTLTPAGTVNDGNGGNNYIVTFVTNTTGVITARAITVTAVTDTKVYDGNTTSAGVPTITTGSLGTGDTVTWTETFDTKNVGTNKTLTPAGTVNDGNGGNNYTVTFVTNTTGVITARAITVTAVTDTKVYDGTTTSAGIPTITTGSLGAGDTVTWTQTFDTKNVGTNKTLTPAGTVNDGNGGNNYTVTFVTNTTGVITARAITVTAVTDTKVYDGTTSSAGVPTITTGSLGTGDTVTWSQTFDTENVGTNKTLTPAGTVNDGNGGNNYTVTFVTNTTGVITARAITVTAVTDTKVYDGNTSSVGIPTITTGSLGTGDTATWTQTFDTKNVGTNKTLTPAGTVNDGNGGNNYTVTFVTNTTGVITARAITVTAVTDTKVYDGTTSSAGVPTLIGTLAAGDAVTWTQTFDTKNVGINKTLTPAGTVNDGNGGNNYAITFVTNTTGVITARAITVTAVTDTKVYDGTTSSAGVPTITTGSLGTGDTVTWTQTFDTPLVGTNKTLTPAGTVNDGNGGNNYTVTLVAVNTGTITGTPLNVTINQAGGQADPTNTSPISFTVVFTASVSNFVTGDVTLSGTAVGVGTTASVAGSGTTYTITVSGMVGDGTVIASIPAGVASDVAGNISLASTSTDNTVTYDTTIPTVTIEQAIGQVDPTNASPINFTVTFSESVSNFVTGDVSFTGSTVGGTLVGTVTGGPTTYNVAVTGMTGSGTVVATIAAGVAADAAGNTNAASTSTDNTVTFDAVGPTVTINQAVGQVDPTNASPINFTVTFSETVANFVTGDVSFTGSTAGGTLVGTVTGGPTTYNVAVTGMTSSGTIVATIAAGAASDALGNLSSASTSTDNVVTYDTVVPTVTINQAIGQADPTNGSPINFTVTFSEAVVTFATGDISFTGSTVGGALVGTVTGGPATYNVAVTGMTGTGTVVATIAAGVATDAAGNANTASTSTDNTVTYDGVVPTVTIEQAIGQVDPTNTSPINFTVTFSETISNFATGDVSFTGSTVGGTLVGTVTGGPTIYNVAVTGMTGSGTVVATIAAGVASDATGNANTASTSIDNTVTYDGVVPTVTINQAIGQADPTNASPINFTVTFSEAVANFATGDVSFTGSTVGGALVGTVTGGPTTYNVAVTGMTGSGTVVATIAAGVASDATGNANTASTSADNTVTFDGAGPTVTINQAGAQVDPTNVSPINFTVIFSEAVSNFATGDVSFTGSTVGGALVGTVTGGPTTYNVAVTGMTGSGTVVATVAAGAASDGLGNTNAASTSTDNTVTFDAVAPTVTIEQAIGQADPTNTSPINFTVTFSEAVVNFATGDVNFTGSTVGGTLVGTVTGGPTTYNVAVTGMTSSGTVVATIAAGVARDASGNNNAASTSIDNTVTYDTTRPVVTIGAPVPISTITGPVDFGITITGATAVNLLPANVTVTVTGTAAVTTITITNGTTNNPTVTLSGITGSGTITITIAAGIASDGAGNTSLAAGPSTTLLVDNAGPVVLFNAYTVPTDGAIVYGGPVQLTVAFNEDVKNDGSAGAANNTANFLLVESGPNLTLDTISCALGAQPDDVQIPVNTATYSNNGGAGPFVATLAINGGTPLPVGSYHLFVCGTTSVEDLLNNELNNGAADTVIDFVVLQATAIVPKTGFPENTVTNLPVQPEGLAYSSTDMWLEIPRLNIKIPIVGVPKTSAGWDVTWLDNQAGWLDGSAYPTWSGNSVITAHVWDALNNPGPFARIKELRYGDQIKIHAFGQVYTYEIRETTTISPANTSAMLKHQDKTWLTLITCEGFQEKTQDYSTRRMVRAILVSVTAEK